MENTNKNDSKLLAFSILVAGVLIAGAVIYTSGSSVKEDKVVVDSNSGEINIKPVDKSDHILGDFNAPVKIVEFSDLECPFCKSFHPTVKQIVDDYDSKVALVYRHFPLDQIHSKARQEAVATECAAELGGNDKFWAYLDRLFEVTPANNGLDLKMLPEIAQYVGLDSQEFESCLFSGKYDSHVEEDLQDAIASGGRGTPYSIVIAPNGKRFPVGGAESYLGLKSIIDMALEEK